MKKLPEFQKTTTVPSPPWTGIGKKIESAMRKAILTFQLFDKVDSLGVALSGGKDSLTLLFLLAALRGKGLPFFSLTAFHVAGRFSCGAQVDSLYLQAICKKLEIPLVILETKQEEQNLSCYSCSRTRRKLLFDACKEQGIYHLAFGHHKDDLAQTFLMNLFHKAEVATMLPKLLMEDFGITILRPLIYVNEQQIQSFAKQNHFLRITCQCPVGQNSMRKKVDLLINEISELFPNARENIAQAGLVYGSDKAKYK